MIEQRGLEKPHCQENRKLTLQMKKLRPVTKENKAVSPGLRVSLSSRCLSALLQPTKAQIDMNVASSRILEAQGPVIAIDKEAGAGICS